MIFKSCPLCFFLLLVTMVPNGCRVTLSPLDSIQDQDVKTVLEKAISSAGGWENYSRIKHISYVKRSVLYLADSTVESDVTQTHHYQLKPELSGTIYWEDNGTTHEIVYTPQGAYKKENGKSIPDREQSAKESFLSAHYVLFVPFKLLDPQTILTYEGLDTLENGRIVDVIKAGYDPEQYANHSTSDIWWYYFNHKTGRHEGSLVYHEPTYAFIENTQSTDAHAIRFQEYRESFRTDQYRQKAFLRGVFYYSDFVLNY